MDAFDYIVDVIEKVFKLKYQETYLRYKQQAAIFCVTFISAQKNIYQSKVDSNRFSWKIATYLPK